MAEEDQVSSVNAEKNLGDTSADRETGQGVATKYSVGHLRNPRPEDQRFIHRREAVDAAFEGAKDEDVWAVWRILRDGL